MLPDFDSAGNLPAGTHAATWQEFEARFGWTPKRVVLLGGLYLALIELRKAGCTTAYMDGSFVTKKDEPEDYDACWDATGVDLRKVDPILLTFDPGRVA